LVELVPRSIILFRWHLLTFLSFSQVFPSYITRERAVTKRSALARLKEQRAEKRARTV
jgi:hypothetical protein